MTLPADKSALVELAPMLRRVANLDPGTVARIRFSGGNATALVWLPFGVLAGRTVADPDSRDAVSRLDVTLRAAEVLDWLDGVRVQQPEPRDADWRGALPPPRGWQRIESIPDDVIRSLVRRGALTLKEEAEREGIPGAQPRAEVADALLDSVVLTATNQGAEAQVTLRMLSALTRMGFLRRGSHASIDRSGRWIRVVAEYGSVYREIPGLGLTLR